MKEIVLFIEIFSNLNENKAKDPVKSIGCSDFFFLSALPVRETIWNMVICLRKFWDPFLF